MCEVCGDRVKINGSKDNAVRYCKKCAKEIDREKTRERVRKHRSKCNENKPLDFNESI